MFIISEQDEQTIINALRVAAEQYRVDAKQAAAQQVTALERQFLRQAEQVEDLAVRIEVGEG